MCVCVCVCVSVCVCVCMKCIEEYFSDGIILHHISRAKCSDLSKPHPQASYPVFSMCNIEKLGIGSGSKAVITVSTVSTVRM